MKHLRRIVLATCVVGLAAASTFACSSFGADGEQVRDDASAESGSTDSSAPDTLSDADDAGCAEPFVLDESFSAALTAPWQQLGTSGEVGVSATLPNGVMPRSPPSALRASGTIPDGGSMAASVSRPIPFVPKSMLVSYALYVPTSTNYAIVGCVLHFAGMSATTVELFVSGAELRSRNGFPDGGRGPSSFVGVQPASGWIRIEMATVTDLVANTLSATVSARALDGTPIATAALAATPLPMLLSGVAVECGIGYADRSDNAGVDRVDVAVDDLEIRACKQ
jgi:hypothetical protein